jgi:hypothetical protein
MISQAVIAAGGRGTRMGERARKFGNKSLIEISGRPILFYTIDWVRQSGITELILTVNHMNLYDQISELFKSDRNIKVVQNTYTKTSAQCLPPLHDLLNDRFLFIYGHAPAPPQHLHALTRIATEGISVSLYPSTTQGETRKSATLSGDSVVLSDYDNLFMEPPHVLDKDFVSNLPNAASWKEGFKTYRGRITGVVARHPSEFHYEADFAVFMDFMNRYLIDI